MTNNAIVELRQQRDETPSELDAGLWGRIAYMQRHIRAVPSYRRARIATLVCVLALIGAFFFLDYKGWTSDTPIGAAFMTILLVGAVLNFRRQKYREALAEVCRTNLSGQRFALDDKGLQWAERGGSSSTIPLSDISDIVDDAERLLIVLSPSRAIMLAKAAYDSAGLEAFSTELKRRWQASRPRVAA